MKIMITGGNGFIGLNLQERLGREHVVFAPSRKDLDLVNASDVRAYFREHSFDAVIHCATWDATQYSNKDTSKILDYNLRMFFNIVRERDNFGRLISLGSGAEFSRPHWTPFMTEDYFGIHVPADPYGFSKYIINKHIESMPGAVNLRLFGVFGKHEDWRIRFISNAAYRALHDLPINIRQDVFFDYLYINDLSDIINRFLYIVPKQKVYNVCTNRTCSLTVLARIVLDSLGKDLPIEVSQEGLGQEYSGDNSRLLSEMKNLRFTPVEEAVRSLCIWYQKNALNNDTKQLKKDMRFKKMSQKITKNERLCPICSSSKKTHLYKQNFNNKVISLIENYDVVVCTNCGFVYADNIPSQTGFNKYYEVMSKYEFNYKDGIVSNDYIDYYTKIVNFLIPHISDKNARILDIGCSTGGLLSIFKLNGYSNLSGIDPSPSCVRATKELYNIGATVNNISNFNSNVKFDVIILSAVLEHLVDFSNSMQKIRSLLKDQGLLFIGVPDAERFDLYISSPFQQFSNEHINYFTQCSIRNFLSVFSFKILEMQQNENKLNLVIDPDIFILSKKTDENNFTIIRDDICKLNIRNYITKCSKIDLEIKSIIQEKLLNKHKIIVWGVGTHTQRLIGSGLDLSKILFFVDSNIRYIGKKLSGIEIKSPSDIQEKEIPILISTYSYQQEIAYQIKEVLKLNNEIITIY